MVGVDALMFRLVTAAFNKGGDILRQTVTNNKTAVPMRRCASNWKLFVGGLAKDTNDTILREAFSIRGEVTEAKVVIDRKTGKSRGFGFVTFARYDPAINSILEMNQWELHGRTVTVMWAKDSYGPFSSDEEEEEEEDGGGGGGGANSDANSTDCNY